MTRGEAEAAATAEGLQLIPSSGPTGYKGVSLHEPAMRHGLEESRYFAQFKGGGTLAPLGYFSSPHEAALAYARYVGPEGCASAVATVPPASVPQTAEEAIEAARAEALVLVRAANATGYRGVKKNASGHTKPYEARVRRDGKNEHLGTFACAEAAALAYARRLGPQETGELARARPASVDHRPSRRAARSDGAGAAAGPAAGGGRCRHLRSEEVTAQPASPPAALGVPVAPEPAAAPTARWRPRRRRRPRRRWRRRRRRRRRRPTSWRARDGDGDDGGDDDGRAGGGAGGGGGACSC